MKTILAVLVLLVGIALPVLGDSEASSGPPGIPTPTGAAIDTELNISRSQLADQIMAMFGSDESGSPTITEKDVNDAMGTLKSVQYAGMKIRGKYTAVETLAEFEKLVGGRRVIWDASGKPGEGFLLLATSDGGYFGAMISSEARSGRTIGDIKAFRLYGAPNIAKLFGLAGPILGSEKGISPLLRGL